MGREASFAECVDMSVCYHTVTMRFYKCKCALCVEPQVVWRRDVAGSVTQHVAKTASATIPVPNCSHPDMAHRSQHYKALNAIDPLKAF